MLSRGSARGRRLGAHPQRRAKGEDAGSLPWGHYGEVPGARLFPGGEAGATRTRRFGASQGPQRPPATPTQPPTGLPVTAAGEGAGGQVPPRPLPPPPARVCLQRVERPTPWVPFASLGLSFPFSKTMDAMTLQHRSSEYLMGEKSTVLPADTGHPKTSRVHNQEPPNS